MTKRPSITERKINASLRGYGTEHRRERARVDLVVQAGNAYCQQDVCLMPSRWIQPGTPWDLGHNDERTAWIGPTHRLCNQQAGASKGGTIIAQRNGYTTRTHDDDGTTRAHYSQEW